MYSVTYYSILKVHYFCQNGLRDILMQGGGFKRSKLSCFLNSFCKLFYKWNGNMEYDVLL